MYQAINNPVNYGGLELKNRIIFAPTTFGLSDEEYFEKIRKIAAGGCAMIIVGLQRRVFISFGKKER